MARPSASPVSLTAALDALLTCLFRLHDPQWCPDSTAGTCTRHTVQLGERLCCLDPSYVAPTPPLGSCKSCNVQMWHSHWLVHSWQHSGARLNC